MLWVSIWCFHLGFAWDLLLFLGLLADCLRFARDLFRVCWGSHGSCLGFAWGLLVVLGGRMGVAWGLLGVGFGVALGLLGFCWGVAWSL